MDVRAEEDATGLGTKPNDRRGPGEAQQVAAGEKTTRS
jgi:hypothetical protein